MHYRFGDNPGPGHSTVPTPDMISSPKLWVESYPQSLKRGGWSIMDRQSAVSQ